MRNVVCAALVLAGCSGGPPATGPNDDEIPGAGPRTGEERAKDGGFDSTPSPESGLGVLSFSPEEAYSGHDGVHAFEVPIAVYDAAGDLKVTPDDPSAVTITPVKLAKPLREDGTYDNGTYFMVSLRKAGTVTLVAESQGKTAQAKITATSYTPAQWTAGETRYTTEGGNGDAPCTQCHAGSSGIDHSPASMASATDEALAAVITTGISTAGFPIQEPTKNHRWTVTDDERAALVTYLRGLSPRGFE